MAGLERTVCSFWVLHVPPVCEWLSDRDTGQKGSHDPCLMSSLGRHFVPLSRPSIQRRLERSHYTPPFSRLMPVPHRFFLFLVPSTKRGILLKMMNYFLISLSQILWGFFYLNGPACLVAHLGQLVPEVRYLTSSLPPPLARLSSSQETTVGKC